MHNILFVQINKISQNRKSGKMTVFLSFKWNYFFQFLGFYHQIESVFNFVLYIIFCLACFDTRMFNTSTSTSIGKSFSWCVLCGVHEIVCKQVNKPNCQFVISHQRDRHRQTRRLASLCVFFRNVEHSKFNREWNINKLVDKIVILDKF